MGTGRLFTLTSSEPKGLTSTHSFWGKYSVRQLQTPSPALSARGEREPRAPSLLLMAGGWQLPVPQYFQYESYTFRSAYIKTDKRLTNER